MDRKVLFRSPDRLREYDERQERALVPVRVDSRPPPLRSATAERARTSTHYLFHEGEIIGIDGVLTWEGCRRVVMDLWYFIGYLVAQTMGGLNTLGIDEDLLDEPIIDALPVGIRVSHDAWLALVDMARLMVIWRCYGREGSSRTRMPHGEVENFADQLWRLCGGQDEDE